MNKAIKNIHDAVKNAQEDPKRQLENIEKNHTIKNHTKNIELKQPKNIEKYVDVIQSIKRDNTLRVSQI